MKNQRSIYQCMGKYIFAIIQSIIAWDICYMIEEMDCYWLDFDNYKTTLEDGLECIIIDTMALSKFE